MTDEIIRIVEHEEVDLTILSVSEVEERNIEMLKIIDNKIFEHNLCSVLVVPLNYRYKKVDTG